MNGVSTKNEGKVFPVSKTIEDKVNFLRKKTWVDNGKTYGPKTDEQIRYDVKLNAATIASIKKTQ